MDDFYKVYIKIGNNGVITAINSSAFLNDTSGWTEIDEGSGDKYHHAQNNYLDKPVFDDNGICNFKLVNGKPILRTEKDKSPELAKIAVEQEISELKTRLADTDYIAAKIAEGAATREEYSEQIAQRADWRTRINELARLIDLSMER